MSAPDFNDLETRIAAEVMRRCAKQPTNLWDMLDLNDDVEDQRALSRVLHRLVELKVLDRAITARGAIFSIRVSGVDIDVVHRNPRWVQAP